MNTTNTPASGEKISPANKAGMSLKSTFRNGGNIGNGKLIKNKISDKAANKAKATNLTSFDERCSCIIDFLLHRYRFTVIDEGKAILFVSPIENALKQIVLGHNYAKSYVLNTCTISFIFSHPDFTVGSGI